jgi:hypothetical protein
MRVRTIVVPLCLLAIGLVPAIQTAAACGAHCE